MSRSTDPDPDHPDRQAHRAILNWAILRYGARLVERGELPAGVWDRQHARREARAAEQEVRQQYGRGVR